MGFWDWPFLKWSLLEHFAGNIYLIEPKNWTFKDYFDEKEKKADKIPTYFKALNENLDAILEALQGKYDSDQENQYTIGRPRSCNTTRNSITRFSFRNQTTEGEL